MKTDAFRDQFERLQKERWSIERAFSPAQRNIVQQAEVQTEIWIEMFAMLERWMMQPAPVQGPPPGFDERHVSRMAKDVGGVGVAGAEIRGFGARGAMRAVDPSEIPTPEMRATAEFNNIFNLIKSWDIDDGSGPCGGNGTHVAKIMLATGWGTAKSPRPHTDYSEMAPSTAKRHGVKQMPVGQWDALCLLVRQFTNSIYNLHQNAHRPMTPAELGSLKVLQVRIDRLLEELTR
jgi:hypothetical protein